MTHFEVDRLGESVTEVREVVKDMQEKIDGFLAMQAMMKDVVEGLAKCDVPWECETREARKERKEKELDEWRSKQNFPDRDYSHRPDGWDGFRSKGDNNDLHGHPRW